MTSGAEQAAAAARAAREKRKPGSATSPKKSTKPPTIIGGIIASVFTKETGMQKYSKLIAAIAGNLIGVLVVWLATKGFATCTDFAVADTCTVFGLTTGQLNAAVLTIINGVFVYAAPRNIPPS